MVDLPCSDFCSADCSLLAVSNGEAVRILKAVVMLSLWFCSWAVWLLSALTAAVDDVRSVRGKWWGDSAAVMMF